MNNNGGSENNVLDKDIKYQKVNSAYELSDMKKFVIEYMNDFETSMLRKFDKANEELRVRLSDAEIKLEKHDVKLQSIQDEAQINQNKIDKINELSSASKKNTDQILANEIRLNSVQKEFSNACFKYDKIYLDNLHVPGTLGEFCTYKNLREFIEASITDTQKLLSFKEKSSAELKTFREKIESLTRGVSSQLDNSENNLRNYSNKMLKDTEANFKREYESLLNKINDLRMENNKYAYDLKKTATDLTGDKEILMKMQAEISKQLEEFNAKSIKNNRELGLNFQSIKEEQETIKRKFAEFSEFFKDIRFQKNLGFQIPKADVRKVSTNMSSNRNINLETKSKSDERLNDVNNFIDGANSNLKSNDKGEIHSFKAKSYLKDYITGSGANLGIKTEKPDAINFNSNSITNSSECLSHRRSNFKSISTEEGFLKMKKESIDCDAPYSDNIKPLPDYSKEKAFTGELIKELTAELRDEDQARVSFKEEGEENLLKKAIKNLDIKVEDEENSNPKNSNMNDEDYFYLNHNSESKAFNDNLANHRANIKFKAQTDKSLPFITASQNNLLSIEFTANRNLNTPNYFPNDSAAINRSVDKNSHSKFKERFPLHSGKDERNGLISYDWSFEKTEREDLAKKEFIENELANIISEIELSFDSKSYNGAAHNKDFAYIMTAFNENFFQFKKDFLKKIFNAEQRMIQIENFSKKKLEELSDQIKKHLPISFNAYIRENNKEKTQEKLTNTNTKIKNIYVENQYFLDDLGACRNVSVKSAGDFGQKFFNNNNNNNNGFSVPEKKSVKNFYLKNTGNLSKPITSLQKDPLSRK